MGLSRGVVAAVLLQLASHVLAHGDDEAHGMDMIMPEMSYSNGTEMELEDMPTYAGLGTHQTQIFAHVALMVLAWFFILPIGQS